jgi:TonB-like protein
MLKPWLDTFAKNTGLTSSAVLSVVAHTVVIVAAVAATATTATERSLAENSIVRFLAPPDRPAGQRAQPEMIKFVAISVPAIGMGTSIQPVEKVKTLEEVVSGRDERDALPLPELPGADSVFLVIEVDSAAKRYAWSAAPAFPPKMLEKKISGFVRAEWVVQPDGSADTASLRIVDATHEDFAQAVRDALPFMRFSPAKIGRRPVSQLVQQEFTFRISVAAADSQPVRKPNP